MVRRMVYADNPRHAPEACWLVWSTVDGQEPTIEDEYLEAPDLEHMPIRYIREDVVADMVAAGHITYDHHLEVVADGDCRITTAATRDFIGDPPTDLNAMHADIAERLRAACEAPPFRAPLAPPRVHALLRETADEIERLQMR